MLKNLIEKISLGQDLTFDESRKITDKIMSGELGDIGITALITALKVKGESSEEIAGFAASMRQHCKRADISNTDAIDVCGTGGDNSNSFNISTAAAFVIAGSGVKVAKHGNRSVSSRSGSADVLESLGIKINLDIPLIERALEEAGLAFLFAPMFHPSMKYAAPSRRELKVKTIFNILGPLCNPASVKKQLIGTYDRKVAKKMVESLQYLDMEKVCFINTENLYDEITLHGETYVYEYSASEPVKEYRLSAGEFGINEIDPVTLKGGDSKKNAEIIESILSGKSGRDERDVVCANAAMGLYVAGVSDDLTKCFKISAESIDSGAAMNVLNTLREI